MKTVLRTITIALSLLLSLHNPTSCTNNAQGINSGVNNGINAHTIPYIEKAIAIMRGDMESKKAAKTSSKSPTSKEKAAALATITQKNNKVSVTGDVRQVIHLTQRDFDSGTYRIQTPHTTIILDSNIEFEPIPSAEVTRTDKPFTGWFAAITVETNDVIIDLNGKTLQASEFFLANAENVFADIELDNAPFSGILFGVLGAFFPGDTEFVAAQNVIIKNGTLGRSDHWCIHGNNNSNITIQDIHAKDFTVAGIELNGIIDSKISNVKMTGLEHIIRTNFLGVAASTLISYLTIIANIPGVECFAGACQQLAAVTAYVNANPELFNTPRIVPQGAMLGISSGSGFLNFTFFPSTPADCELSAFLSGGRTIENITLENISIDGLKNAPEESVLIASRANGQLLNLPLLGIPVFGALTWDSAFDAEGNFAPSPFLLAQIYVINVQLCLDFDTISAILPPNYPAIANSILTGNEAEFIANTFPGFGIALDSVPIKGTFGVRFDCSNKGTLKNITTKNIENVGMPGQTLATIPDGIYYEGLLQETRYQGNDVWGFEFGTQDKGLVKDCHACNISSLHGGEIFGFDLITDNIATTVDSCTCTKVVGFADDTLSIVNPPATAYGFRSQNNSGPVEFSKSSAKKITAPRFAFGFAAEETDGIRLTQCNAEEISATSSKDLVSSPKQAFGFDLEGAKNTVLCCVSAKNIEIKGEEGASESASVAAGIGIDAESEGTTIICPTLKKIKGGAGQGVKIYDLGSNTVIKEGKKCAKICK